MRLTASVGRMGVNKKHDVALVQKILKGVKVKTRMGTQPIRKGPIDGRYTRDMEGEIVCLQGVAKLRETGKLEPTTQTMNAINRIVPPNLRNLSAMEGTTSVFATGKSNPNADRVARDIEAKAPFPKSERKALAEAVRKVGKETGFCIRRGSDFITPEGNFATKMGFDMSSIPEAGTGQDATKAVAKVLAGTKGWTAISGTPLACKTNLKLKCLKNPGKPKIADVKTIGLNSIPKHAIMQAVLAGAINLAKSGRLDTPEGKKERELLAEAADGFDQAVADAVRKQLEKLGPLFMTVRTKMLIAAGMGSLRPFLDDALRSLAAPDQETLDRVAIYFKPDPDSQRPGKGNPREISRRILPPLERANIELAKPADELFGAPGSTRDKGRAAFKHLEKTGATGTVRSGIIWLAQDKIFNFSGLQMARVILHEALHLVLGVSAAEQDFRYLEDGGVEGLPVDVAVKNADSYVGVVLHSVLDDALMPGQFTLRGE